MYRLAAVTSLLVVLLLLAGLLTLVLTFFWQVLEIIPRAVEAFAIGGFWGAEARTGGVMDPALAERILMADQLVAALGELRAYFWVLLFLGLAGMILAGFRDKVSRFTGVMAAIIALFALLPLIGMGGVLEALPFGWSWHFFPPMILFFGGAACMLWKLEGNELKGASHV